MIAIKYVRQRTYKTLKYCFCISKTTQDDIDAFITAQKGAMADLGIQGNTRSKRTK